MTRYQVLTIGLLAAVVLIAIGTIKHDVLEIHNSGATMCLECIGLE